MTSSSESFLRWDNHSQCLVPQGGSNSVPNRPDLSLAGQPQFETSTSTLANRHGRSQDRRIDGGRAVLRQQTVDYDKVLEAGYEFSKRFYYILFLGRGPDVFLVKIGNLDRAHDHYQSYLEFVQSTHSNYCPTQTHGFLKFQEFPHDFALFHRRVLTLLELPRESVVSVMVYEEFFGCIHALDSERYLALKAIYEARGRPSQNANKTVACLLR